MSMNKKWLDLVEPTDDYRLLGVNDRKLVNDARKYPYPMFDELKIEVKNACTITEEIGSAINKRITDQMSQAKKKQLAVVYEVLDRLPPSKRKDRSTKTLKREGKVFVLSRDDVHRAVSSLVSEINRFATTSPSDGYRVRVRLGSINTLEGHFEPGEDDMHKIS